MKPVKFICLIALVVLSTSSGYSKDVMLESWKKFASSETAEDMILWMKREAMNEFVKSGKSGRFDKSTPSFYGSLGIFVTLKKGNRVRGCYGSFSHSYDNISMVLMDYMKGALRNDPRYLPLGIEELADTSIIVTITSRPQPVEDIYMVDLLKYGVMITFENGTSIIIVPAEFKTHSFLINSIRNRKVANISAFRSVTISFAK